MLGIEKVAAMEKTIDTKIASPTGGSTLDIGKVAAVEKRLMNKILVVANCHNKKAVKNNMI